VSKAKRSGREGEEGREEREENVHCILVLSGLDVNDVTSAFNRSKEGLGWVHEPIDLQSDAKGSVSSSSSLVAFLPLSHLRKARRRRRRTRSEETNSP